MGDWHRTSTSKQLADHLREKLALGSWRGKMPGVMKLADELGVSRDTVEVALGELEREGLLRSQGRGKRRDIVAEGMAARKLKLRVVVLLYEPADRNVHYLVELMHALLEAGHDAEFAPVTQSELNSSSARLARLVEHAAADAWVILAASREVLEWFAASSLPTFAIFGRAHRLPIASIAPDKVAPMREAVRRLVGLGHRRIVLLCRPHRVIPEPGRFERCFLEELEALGITTGSYHLQIWEETHVGLDKALESLFRFTPPTALLIEEAPPLTATLQFCMKHGLRVPEHLSLLCTDPDPAFEWCHPSIAHIRWDRLPMIRRTVRWASNLQMGKRDQQKGFFKAHFLDGGTIGPVPAAKA